MSHNSRFRPFAFNAGLAFFLLLFFPLEPHAATSASVSGQCNIYGAGHATAPGPGGSVGGGDGGGILPFEITLPAGMDRSCTLDLTGTIDYGGCCPATGPDGSAFTGIVAAPIYSGLAGCDLSVRGRYLTGVFLDDSEPADPAPEAIIFSSIDFPELSPALRQIFFVGDGWTGQESGALQVFHIPDGATRLFLGYQDRCSTSPNVPGCYDDNSGLVTGMVTFSVPTSAIPGSNLSMRLDQNVPNPFNPKTSISFTITQAGPYELDIYTASGQLVRSVHHGWLEPGYYTRSWDGLDSDARPAASGVYFCRLEGPSETRTMRMALLR
jgi:hypothetical protein